MFTDVRAAWAEQQTTASYPVSFYGKTLSLFLYSALFSALTSFPPVITVQV